MGRGLGVLQKGILRLLLDRGEMLRVRALLGILRGWRGKPWKRQVFDRATVGPLEYSRGYATLSRALERLRCRGLVQVYKNVTGYGTVTGLTSAGAEVARGIAEAEPRPPAS